MWVITLNPLYLAIISYPIFLPFYSKVSWHLGYLILFPNKTYFKNVFWQEICFFCSSCKKIYSNLCLSSIVIKNVMASGELVLNSRQSLIRTPSSPFHVHPCSAVFGAIKTNFHVGVSAVCSQVFARSDPPVSIPEKVLFLVVKIQDMVRHGEACCHQASLKLRWHQCTTERAT